MKPLVVEGFTPHRDQLDKIRIIENDGYKYHILTTGRQYGKSILGQNLLLKWALENPKSVVMNRLGYHDREPVWVQFNRRHGF